MELELSTDGTYRGLRLIVLDNGMLRVIVMPEAGGKIWQISYKPSGTDLLWNNPQIPPAVHDIDTPYDDVWSGGWDELFPVDEEAIILGERFPDHGEFWTGKWDAKPFSSSNEIGVRLSFFTPISSIEIEKTLVLKRGMNRLFFHHRFINRGITSFPFLWKLHPAFNVGNQHRLDMPPMRVVREPGFPGTLEQAPLEFDWPFVETPRGIVDLRQVPGPNQGQLYFFYGTRLEKGWCSVTNKASGLACGLRFDPGIFPTCWLFASYGGWRNYNVAVLEPCTGYPLDFDSLVTAGRHRTLMPEETLETDVLFTVEEGHQSVSDITSDGDIVESHEDPSQATSPQN